MNKWIVYCFFILPVFGKAQKVENIVFEGAGIRGLAYCGAIKALEQNNQIAEIKRIGGTSAGAITALLFSVGYTGVDIEKIIGETNFRKFNDGGFPILSGVRRIQKKYGYYKGDRFEKWLQNLVAAKTKNALISFKELAKNYKALYITGTNLSSQKEIIFSAETFPDMPVVKAVRISVSIPIYYQAVLMKKDGTIINKPKKSDVYEVMVDGGFMNNFPIQLFDSINYFHTDSGKHSYFANPHTLGFRIDNKLQIELDKNPFNTSLMPIEINKADNYLKALLILLTERLNRQKLSAADWERTISIDDGGINPRVRKMKKVEIELLVKNGFDATIDFLNKKQLIQSK